MAIFLSRCSKIGSALTPYSLGNGLEGVSRRTCETRHALSLVRLESNLWKIKRPKPNYSLFQIVDVPMSAFKRTFEEDILSIFLLQSRHKWQQGI